jgi:hypothetical protein
LAHILRAGNPSVEQTLRKGIGNRRNSIHFLTGTACANNHLSDAEAPPGNVHNLKTKQPALNYETKN